MSSSTTIQFCIAAYSIVIFLDLVFSRRLKRFVVEVLVLLAMIFIDGLITNEAIGHVAFGTKASSVTILVVMFGAILLGITARYIFYLKGKFSWLDFIKPACISPILLLPLIGSVEATKELEPMQVLSFALLAFQNGFFWQMVLGRARPKP